VKVKETEGSASTPITYIGTEDKEQSNAAASTCKRTEVSNCSSLGPREHYAAQMTEACSCSANRQLCPQPSGPLFQVQGHGGGDLEEPSDSDGNDNKEDHPNHHPDTSP
jgi:hypothetical protein